MEAAGFRSETPWNNTKGVIAKIWLSKSILLSKIQTPNVNIQSENQIWIA